LGRERWEPVFGSTMNTYRIEVPRRVERFGAIWIKEGNLCLTGKYITTMHGEDTKGTETAGVYPVDILAEFYFGRNYSWINPLYCFPQSGQRSKDTTAVLERFAHPRVGQASRPAIRRPHSPGQSPGTPCPLKGRRGTKCRKEKIEDTTNPPMFRPVSRCVRGW